MRLENDTEESSLYLQSAPLYRDFVQFPRSQSIDAIKVWCFSILSELKVSPLHNETRSYYREQRPRRGSDPSKDRGICASRASA